MTDPFDKAALRRRLREVRASVDDRARRAVALGEAIVALPAYAATDVVMSFASFGSEVDTGPLHTRVWDDGKALALPRVEDGILVAVEVGRDEPLVRSALGVDEPLGPAAALRRLHGALVLVPGLAFTPDGHRLGYGRGYYDRFLASLPPSAVTVGVCFREQLVDDLPLDDHDVAAQLLVSV